MEEIGKVLDKYGLPGLFFLLICALCYLVLREAVSAGFKTAEQERDKQIKQDLMGIEKRLGRMEKQWEVAYQTQFKVYQLFWAMAAKLRILLDDVQPKTWEGDVTAPNESFDFIKKIRNRLLMKKPSLDTAFVNKIEYFLMLCRRYLVALRYEREFELEMGRVDSESKQFETIRERVEGRRLDKEKAASDIESVLEALDQHIKERYFPDDSDYVSYARVRVNRLGEVRDEKGDLLGNISDEGNFTPMI